MKKLLLVFSFLSLFTGFVLAQTEHPAATTPEKTQTEKHHKKAHKNKAAHVKSNESTTKAKKN
jgi:hypothetical protein